MRVYSNPPLQTPTKHFTFEISVRSFQVFDLISLAAKNPPVKAFLCLCVCARAHAALGVSSSPFSNRKLMRSSTEDRGKRPFLSTLNHLRVKKREELREEEKKIQPCCIDSTLCNLPIFFSSSLPLFTLICLFQHFLKNYFVVFMKSSDRKWIKVCD